MKLYIILLIFLGLILIMNYSEKYNIEKFVNYGAEDFDHESTKFTVIEGVNHPAGIVDYVYGGS